MYKNDDNLQNKGRPCNVIPHFVAPINRMRRDMPRLARLCGIFQLVTLLYMKIIVAFVHGIAAAPHGGNARPQSPAAHTAPINRKAPAAARPHAHIDAALNRTAPTALLYRTTARRPAAPRRAALASSLGAQYSPLPQARRQPQPAC